MFQVPKLSPELCSVLDLLILVLLNLVVDIDQQLNDEDDLLLLLVLKLLGEDLVDSILLLQQRLALIDQLGGVLVVGLELVNSLLHVASVVAHLLSVLDGRLALDFSSSIVSNILLLIELAIGDKRDDQ